MSGLTVVVPVKPWRLSKSRLDLPYEARESLARAFALDVLEALSGSSLVEQLVIVTAERELSGVARRLGAVLLPDRPMVALDGINTAVASGRWWSSKRRSEDPIVVVPADLPALTSAAFDRTICLMRGGDTSFVPDAVGQGTTLFWARAPQLLDVAYGPRSAAEHARRGARAVPDADPRLRWDVDTAVDLVEARRMGVGAHTHVALDTIGGRPRQGAKGRGAPSGFSCVASVIRTAWKQPNSGDDRRRT